MNKKLFNFLFGAMLISVCVGCGADTTNTISTETVNETQTRETTPEQTEKATATPEETIEPVKKVAIETETPESEQAEALTTEPVSEQAEESTTEAGSVEYKELPEDASECVAIEDYLYDKATAWVVYDVVITGADGMTTVCFDIPDSMDGLEGDSYIIYAFDNTDFKKVPCVLKANTVSFETEASGVYALVRYDSNVMSNNEFVENSDLIVKEDRYVAMVMYTTQKMDVLDMPKYGLVIGTIEENQKVEVNSIIDDWVYFYHGDGLGSIPMENLSDTPK